MDSREGCCNNYGIYQNVFPMLMRQKIEICGTEFLHRPRSNDKPRGGLSWGPGEFLHSNSCRVGQVAGEGTREFPDSLAFWEEQDTDPCTALWGSRWDGHNLGALEGLDLETGHVGSLDGMLCDLSEGLHLSESVPSSVKSKEW